MSSLHGGAAAAACWDHTLHQHVKMILVTMMLVDMVVMVRI